MSEAAQSPRSIRNLRFAIIAAPAAWMLQLILSWIVASFSCAEGATATPVGAGAARVLLIAFDIAAVAICAIALYVGLRAWRHSGDAGITAVHGREPVDFLTAVALFMAATFTLATLLQAVPSFSLPVCATFQ